MPNRFQVGQRWISEGEPELGLGEVLRVSGGTVTLTFAAAQAKREYAAASAPLRRAAFRVGDTFKNAADTPFKVESVTEREGLLYYGCGGLELCEGALNPALAFSTPQDRLFSSRFDSSAAFDLRVATLGHQFRRRKSTVRGFLGGRIDLLPHQLSIAAEVTGRLFPRVLLADEVGLGKTIEAGLILHRLLLTGRARRVLILVPESLVHQWFLELLRRFNLWFHIYDEPRCRAIEEANPGANPFLDDQLLLCDLGLFTGPGNRLPQAQEAGWDLLIVDEAHHLQWSDAGASPGYAAVEALGRAAPGLLLLTATPEQLGMASHFARLRLLDPDRFHDFEAFLREAEGFREIAQLAEKLDRAQEFTTAEVAGLAGILRESESTLRPKLARIENGDEPTRKSLIEALLDQHGTGRVVFRNTRATVAGFRKRTPQLYPLAAPAKHSAVFKSLAGEWAADADLEAGAVFRPNFALDPRIDWLAGLLRTLGQDKLLLICHTQAKAEAIEAALRSRITVKLAVFHEGLSLVRRDRAAAWFADPAGARLLLCSEIGSEGRNFQFAHHLVLFDLPLDPGLLEQRIGRLDRIGQASAVQVHVPFVRGSHQEPLARWYQEGLDAFAENLPGSLELAERFGARLRQLAQHAAETGEADQPGLEDLLRAARVARREVAERLEQGRDRLLERNSFRPEAADRLITEIRGQDQQPSLDGFLLRILEHFFIEVEEVAPRTYHLGSAGVLAETFPGLTSEGLTVTADRPRALVREDLQFLTWDHPLVTGAMDLMLGSEQGTSGFAHWPDPKVSGLYLEAIYLLECVAPPGLHLDRFLPPTPLRVLVDHRLQNLAAILPRPQLLRQLEEGLGKLQLKIPDIVADLLPRMLERAEFFVEARVAEIRARARQEMTTRMGQEISRLRDLQKVNRSVRDLEIESLVAQQLLLEQHIGEARVRLDCVRLIQRGPAKK